VESSIEAEARFVQKMPDRIVRARRQVLHQTPMDIVGDTDVVDQVLHLRVAERQRVYLRVVLPRLLGGAGHCPNTPASTMAQVERPKRREVLCG
jgi:hypothetical protein